VLVLELQEVSLRRDVDEAFPLIITHILPSSVPDAMAEKMKSKIKRSTRKIGGTLLKYSKMAVSHERFIDVARSAFRKTDIDGTGTLNKTELVVAVLLLYSFLNRRFPGKNHKPPSTEVILKMFDSHDVDKTGAMSEAEFISFAQDICVELVPRVFLQMVGSVAVAPFVAILLYATICVILSFTSEWMYAIFRFVPRALLTPLLASVFSALILPPIVDKIERSYIRLAENTGVIKKKAL